MGKLVVVTSKIPVDLKTRLRRLNVNVSEVIRNALEAEAERLEMERLKRLSEEASVILQKIPSEELVESIRIGRESRP
jgi:post-segregation antitoxin (ccd killing protein)